MDVADACHAQRVRTVAVTAGYMRAEPRRALYEKIDAANVDLKAFTEQFYERHAGGRLAPVKETLEYLVKETQVWTEITTLLIPGLNDSEREVAELSAWVAGTLGPDVPLHFSAFHPAYRTTARPPTPPATLRAARDIARREGLHHVYTGNVHDREGDTTFCPSCGAEIIVRDWYEIVASSLEGGMCGACGAPVAGRFGEGVGAFGGRCLRVSLE
jgi:pyruvate formate lyase activating enzyme